MFAVIEETFKLDSGVNSGKKKIRKVSQILYLREQERVSLEACRPRCTDVLKKKKKSVEQDAVGLSEAASSHPRRLQVD